MTDAWALVKVLQLSDGTRIEAQRTRTRFLKRGGWGLIRGDGQRFVACLTLCLKCSVETILVWLPSLVPMSGRLLQLAFEK